MGWRVSCPRSLKKVPDSQYRKEESLVSWAGSFVQRTLRIYLLVLEEELFDLVDGLSQGRTTKWISVLY